MDPDHIFWLKRWVAIRRLPWNNTGTGQLMALMYTTYLTEVFSWMMDRKKCCPECTYYDTNSKQGDQNGQSQK